MPSSASGSAATPPSTLPLTPELCVKGGNGGCGGCGGESGSNGASAAACELSDVGPARGGIRVASPHASRSSHVAVQPSSIAAASAASGATAAAAHTAALPPLPRPHVAG
eukprot:268795-Chlamydomonas_euryale.AAC.2